MTVTTKIQPDGGRLVVVKNPDLLLSEQKATELAFKIMDAIFVPPSETAQTIIETVAESFGLTVKVMLSRLRDSNVRWPRHIAFCIAREITMEGSVHLGRQFANRDHGTVLNAVEQCKNRCATEPEFKAQYDRI